jgi:FkbM family methyltransferase
MDNKIKTNNYLQKKIANRLFSSETYNWLRLFKVIISSFFKVKTDPVFHMFPWIINKEDKVLDIGANIGQYALQLSKYLGENGRIYSFEPVKNNYKFLTKMISLMNLKHVTPLNIGISDVKGTENIMIPVIDKDLAITARAVLEKSMNDKSDADYISEMISTDTIDGITNLYHLDNIKLIKCDTEGSELRVLAGGMKTIEKEKPILVFEVDPKVPGLNIIYELGYEAFYIDHNKFVDISKEVSRQDPILIHKSFIERHKDLFEH